MPSIFDEQVEPKPEEPVLIEAYHPEPQAETARRSGLAYSAGVVFFGSVAFMLLLGWGADLILGSSPWGLVAGIVIGSIIGFTQFFRITSRIFKQSASGPDVRPLMSPGKSDDEGPSL